jgi:hypothetical protein
VPLDWGEGVAGYNMESMNVDHSGQQVWRSPF